MIARRIIGIVMLLTALAVVVLSLLGAYYVGDALKSVTTSIKSSLQLTSSGLSTARGSLLVAQGTFADVAAALDTSVTTTANLSDILLDTRPLLENVKSVTTQEVPENLESIQDALPSIIQVAAVIDDTMTRLADFGFSQELKLPLGVTVPLQFDLGITYDPAVPFDESLAQFQGSLEGVPESLRALETDLNTTIDNTAILATDLEATSTSLADVGARMGELETVMSDYVTVIDDVTTALADVQEQIDGRLDLIATGARGIFALLALSQLAPLYLGYELITGRRDPNGATSEAAAATAADTTSYGFDTFEPQPTTPPATEAHQVPPTRLPPPEV